MDPISIAGAIAAAFTTEVGKELLVALFSRFTQKYGRRSKPVASLRDLREEPGSQRRQEEVASQIEGAGALQDPDLRSLFEELMESARSSPAIIYQYVPPQRVDKSTLADAEARLAELPLDHVPSPAPLPWGSRVPLSRNRLFVGRQEDLQALAEALKGDGGGDGVLTAAVTGLGGVGKTQLASAFVHRYGQFFAGGVFWLSFADRRAIPDEIAACGGVGRLALRPDFEVLPLDRQVGLVRGAWRSPLPSLLVFDGCEEEELLEQWRPTTGRARVLITSRRRKWGAALGVQSLPVRVLPRPESIALLRAHRDDLTADHADAIAEELGDLPLALHLAGSFLASYEHAGFGAPEEYLQDLQREGLDHPSLREGGRTSITGHERQVARTFALSYRRLDREEATDAVALALLARAACFPPGEPISRPWLLETLNMPGGSFEAERRAEDALARLVALGLLEEEGDGDLVLHRLLVAFVQGVAGEDEPCETVMEALRRRMRDESLGEVERREVASLLTRLGWLDDLRQAIAPSFIASWLDDFLVYLDLIFRYLSHEQVEAAWTVVDHILSNLPPYRLEEKRAALLARRAMAKGRKAERLQDLELLKAAEKDYRAAGPLVEKVPSSQERWKLMALVALGLANITRIRAEVAPTGVEALRAEALEFGEEALAFYHKASEPAGSAEDDHLLVSIYGNLSQIHAVLEQWDASREASERALEVLGSRPTKGRDPYASDRAWVLSARADMHLRKGQALGSLPDYARGYEDAAEALELLEDTPDSPDVFYVHITAADCAWGMSTLLQGGSAESRRALARRHIDAARVLGDEELIAHLSRFPDQLAQVS